MALVAWARSFFWWFGARALAENSAQIRGVPVVAKPTKLVLVSAAQPSPVLVKNSVGSSRGHSWQATGFKPPIRCCSRGHRLPCASYCRVGYFYWVLGFWLSGRLALTMQSSTFRPCGPPRDALKRAPYCWRYTTIRMPTLRLV